MYVLHISEGESGCITNRAAVGHARSWKHTHTPSFVQNGTEQNRTEQNQQLQNTSTVPFITVKQRSGRNAKQKLPSR